MLVSLVAGALWAMLPAYVPNNVAVLAGGGRPIDGGREFAGRRVLGDGKTWRGTAVGTLGGLALAALLNVARPSASALLGVDLPAFPPLAALGLAFGAMLGDVLASLLKRRLGRQRGAAVPGLDQLDFVVGALGLAVLLAPAWTLATFSLGRLVVVAVATPLLHVTTNAGAYWLGLKSEPW
ncbi:CDP-diglyceride synthetase [Haloplanus vescus]|uniref:CDP-archaeol synthase n=1 Tax=Haloplanus vescus TaxID=555874 RepID=A0A1H3XB25_9EURY|nr:CDP-2,3-bis-(O-geranylgeranyl)-sn-glycerol synthase [Haloplanus vescus]SDZ96596.1 CDP-diglyceride synthetase [Haloplanus vescus]